MTSDFYTHEFNSLVWVSRDFKVAWQLSLARAGPIGFIINLLSRSIDFASPLSIHL